jgi:FXSXX-COOH protein
MCDDFIEHGDDGLVDVSDIPLHALDKFDDSTLARELRRFLAPERHDSEPVATFNSYIDP